MKKILFMLTPLAAALVACNGGSSNSTNGFSNQSSKVATTSVVGDVDQPPVGVTWISGSSMYGFTSTNNTPSARRTDISPSGSNSQVWRTPDGKIWVHSSDYGIIGTTGNNIHNATLAALWNYDPSDNTWMLVKVESMTAVYGAQGVGMNTSTPGIRSGSYTWTDQSGNLWLFGGQAGDEVNTLKGDLWKYDVKLNQWIWMKGSDNVSSIFAYGMNNAGLESDSYTPNARTNGSAWSDESGNLWMFGGQSNDGLTAYGKSGSYYRADVWRYNIERNKWSLMSEFETAGAHNTYATNNNLVMQTGEDPGVYTPVPGLIGASVAYNPVDGRAYIFGGAATAGGVYGYQIAGVTPNANRNSVQNVLWAYDVRKNMWDLGVGNKAYPTSATAGDLGVESGANVPSPRFGANLWIDKNGYVWLYGGSSSNLVGNRGYMSDIWRLGPGGWALMSGTAATYDNTSDSATFDQFSPVDQATVYGTKGVLSNTNSMGARAGASVVYDEKSDSAYIFGGSSHLYGIGSYADLWQIKANVIISSSLEDIPVDQITWTNNSLKDIPGNQFGLYGMQLVNNSSSSSLRSITLVDGEGFPSNGTYDKDGLPLSDFSFDKTRSTCFVSGKMITLPPKSSCSLVVRYAPTSPVIMENALELQLQFISDDNKTHLTNKFSTVYSARTYAKCDITQYSWNNCVY